jgi:serine/threonine protein kinase
MEPGGPNSKIKISEESFMKTMCGTPNYLAPEVRKKRTFNFSSPYFIGPSHLSLKRVDEHTHYIY